MANTARNFELRNYEAETDILGTLLANNDLISTVQDFLRPEHFSEPVNGRIYAAMLEMFSAGDLANPITLKARFERDDALKDIGGGKYLIQMVASASSLISVPQYAKSIIELWKRRQMIAWCKEAMDNLCDDFTSTPDELAAKLVGRINDMDSQESRREVIRADLLTEQIIDDLRKDVSPISTGMERLDKAMGGGLFPGFTYGFGARKKVGKTILAGTISYNLEQQGVKHLLIAGEMGAKQIHQRLLSRHANAKSCAFRLKNMQSKEFVQSLAEYSVNSGKHTYYQNAAGLTFDDLKQYMSRAVYKLKVKGVILDYWQLVGGKKPSESEAKHLDSVAQWIADFCRSHGIWSVVFAQINQDGNTRGGEGLRLACDQMYQIHRPDTTAPSSWVEMMDTRYTEWGDIGSEHEPGWELVDTGPYFREYGSEF